MTKVVLIRHARSTANAEGVLAGRTPGVRLDDIGREQAAALKALLGGISFAAAYSSPIERCLETATLAGLPDVEVHEGISECDYGEWSGVKLETLSSQEIWEDIKARPSVVAFPGGESMQQMFQRTADAVAELAGRHGKDDIIAIFSHGDPIKAILAHAFNMDLDDFQRLHVNPAGVSVVEYGDGHPRVLCVNAGGDVAALLGAHSTATVGGGDIAGVGSTP